MIWMLLRYSTRLATPITKRLWHIDDNLRIRDLCFVKMDGRKVLIYTTQSGMRATTIDGTPIHVNVDTHNQLQHVASSMDGSQLVSAEFENQYIGPFNWSIHQTRSNGSLKKLATYQLDAQPKSICWTPDGNLIILLRYGATCVTKLSSQTGKKLWRQGSVADLSDPLHVTVSPGSDSVFVSDYNGRCIRELSADDSHIQDIPTPDINPDVVCVDRSGSTLFVCQEKQEEDIQDIYMLRVDSKRLVKVIRTSSDVRNIRLHEDKYLAVGTDEGLILYDVSGSL